MPPRQTRTENIAGLASQVAATATADEAVSEYLKTLAVVYGFNGTDLARIAARIAADGLADPADEGLLTTNLIQLFNGTTWDRWRSGGSASPLLGSAHVSPVMNPVLQVDETTNDSDKLFTVPANTEWRIIMLLAELSSTATVGNRQLALRIQDADADLIGFFVAGLVQAASLTFAYQFLPGVARETAVVNANVFIPIPPDLWLPPGFMIRVVDDAAIDAAADDMVLQMLVDERTIP